MGAVQHCRGRRRFDAQRLGEERKMRQISVILLMAVVMATVTVFGMMAIGSNPVRPSANANANANAPIDVMKMMRDAKDLPTQSYPAH
jgi:flagellar basal body-associated protein FliL